MSFVPVADADPGLIERWQHLASVSDPNPFFEPAAVLPASRRLPGGSDAALLVAHDGDELRFLAPVSRLGRYHKVPMATLATWVHDYCFLGTPLVAAPAAADATRAVLDRCRRDGGWLGLPVLSLDGPVATALGVGPVVMSRWERPVVRRRPAADYADGRMSARHVKNLRRLQRNLASHLGEEVELTDAAGTGELDRGIEEFLRVEASGWKGRSGTAMACSAGHGEFFREMCHGFAAIGRLELWLYGTRRRTVAAQCNIRAGTTVFHFKIAYDEELRRFSAGTYLDLRMLDLFHADDSLAVIDSCAAPGPSLSEQLYPDRRLLGDVVVPVGGAASALAARATGSALAMKRGWRGRMGADRR